MKEPIETRGDQLNPDAIHHGDVSYPSARADGEASCGTAVSAGHVTAVLPATRELLDRYATAPHVMTPDRASAVEVIRRHGSRSDADALLAAFLDDPQEREGLLPVLAQHGDVAMGERLVAACTAGGRLREGVPDSVLHVVGYLGYAPAERLLWDYAEMPELHHSAGVPEASLGLIHLPCRDLRDEIGQALERHVGDGIFPELLPALAAKTGDPSWLGRLVEWGDTASTDCNGGLILGIALFGASARAEFIRMLWNPRWEAGDTSTGAARWAYAGARVLGLSMSVLYDDLVGRLTSDIGERDKRHCVKTFAALAGLWARRPWLGVRAAPDPTETSETLYDLLFQWSTPHADDALLGLAYRVFGDPDEPIFADLHRLESELRVRRTYELEIRTLQARR